MKQQPLNGNIRDAIKEDGDLARKKQFKEGKKKRMILDESGLPHV